MEILIYDNFRSVVKTPRISQNRPQRQKKTLTGLSEKLSAVNQENKSQNQLDMSIFFCNYAPNVKIDWSGYRLYADISLSVEPPTNKTKAEYPNFNLFPER